MNNNETIEDKEILYRRVKVHKPNIHFNDRRYERHKSGKIEVLPLAFYDRNREISVDRASKHNFDPSKTQRDKTDGIAKLITAKVRDIDIDIEDYKIDVKYDPDDMNDAHSIIVMIPDADNQIPAENVDYPTQDLREDLARIANQLGWVIEPAF